MKSVLLEFISTDTKTIIFVIRQDWEEKGIEDEEPWVFEADFNESDAINCVKEIRELYSEWEDNSYRDQYLTQIKLEERSTFYSIGNKIFSDELMNAIKGYDLIYFVPFSALHHLPLHAMRYKDEDIIDRFACSYLPSASVLQFINKNKERPKAFNFKGIGVDFKDKERVFVDEIDDLMDENYFHRKEMFIEEEATKINFFKNNEAYNILHCSTHGYVSKENALKSSIILFMPKQHRQMLERLKSKDKYLLEFETNTQIQESCITVEDLIKNLNTPFELIVMSACVTGENKNESGDELIGLSRGLFYSGTKAMILSLFNVDKGVLVYENTHIKNFYKHWIIHKEPKAIAFQNYIKTIKKTNRYKHPFYWFAYILVGNPY